MPDMPPRVCLRFLVPSSLDIFPLSKLALTSGIAWRCTSEMMLRRELGGYVRRSGRKNPCTEPVSSVVLRSGRFTLLLCGTILQWLWGNTHALDRIILKSVPAINAPVIEDKTYKLSVDFVFDHCPQEYWIFYNREEQRLVIEFFGVHIDHSDIEIRGTSILSDLVVKNNEKTPALNGIGSQISLAMEEGWHYESWIISGNVLRLQIWIPLDPHKNLETRKKRYILPVLLGIIGVVSLAVLLVYGIS